MNTILSMFLLVISIMIPTTSFAEQPPKTEKDFHEGNVEWISQCNLVVSTAIVRITDRDMNHDPKQVEQFSIEVWSDSENRIKEYVITETGIDTGIFDAIVFLTFEETPGNRIQAIVGDMVFAKYIDYTLPNTFKEKVEIVDMFVMSDLFMSEQENNDHPSKLNYDSCTQMYLEEFPERVNQHIIFYPSPLKQIKSGILIDEVQCKESLILVTKNDGSPACVKPESKSKLIQRDWIKFQFSFCGADGFDSKGNLNTNNSTHHWDENECEWKYVGPATNSINKWSGAPIYKEQKEN